MYGMVALKEAVRVPHQQERSMKRSFRSSKECTLSFPKVELHANMHPIIELAIPPPPSCHNITYSSYNANTGRKESSHQSQSTRGLVSRSPHHGPIVSDSGRTRRCCTVLPRTFVRSFVRSFVRTGAGIPTGKYARDSYEPLSTDPQVGAGPA
jgi:hypothetical protein